MRSEIGFDGVRADHQHQDAKLTRLRAFIKDLSRRGAPTSEARGMR
jgi:hypothetical protein